MTKPKVKKQPGHGIDTQQVFDGLVKNALHFLDEAIKDFESGDLQQSLINFATGVELILKARLLLEHWTLILSDPTLADPVKFINGKFHSVGIQESIQRLRKIVGLPIPNTAKEAFEGIWEHRKKMIHFYHPEYIATKDAKAKEEIAGLELNGWGHLYVLVARNWHQEFADYRVRFESIDSEMINHKEFLKGKYEGLKSQINEEIAAGTHYMECSLCGYKASRLEVDEYPIFNGFCQVCIGWMIFLEAKCDNCDTINYYDMNDDERVCYKCKHTLSMDYLVELYGNEIPSDGKFTNGYCEECHYAFPGEKTVVEIDAGEMTKYLCLSCFTFFDEMDHCQRCGANIAGNHPETGTYGCVECGEALQDKRDQE